MRKFLLLSLLVISFGALYAEGYNYQFRLTLKDKGQSQYSTEKPEDFLSQKSIGRRKKYNIPVTENDLPISDEYIKMIEDIGGIVVAKSKWLYSVAVHCTDSAKVEELKELPFVSDALFVWKGLPIAQKVIEDTIVSYPIVEQVIFGSYYGKATDNIKLNNGQYLHKQGFKGQGIDIAVIDAGFSNLPKIEMLDNINVKGSKGFVFENSDLFSNANQHGLNVLSCIATNKEFQFVGTAPQADFWLLGSEDSRSEFPIEEDYWAAAVEYADSVGVDVISTSLGYHKFDNPATSFTHKDLDGKTTFITRAANRAVQKGMFVVSSAGNSGNSPWQKITPPADAAYVLTVGAVQRDSIIAKFSSRGLSADLRVKPDVMALGAGTAVVDDKGLVVAKSGTSFSAPIMAGLVACLWQANPTLTNRELLRVIKEASDRYESPDESYGYGIPDMEKAMQIAKEFVVQKELKRSRK